uniref:putative pectinesterase 14 n=1 Tax=Erigeron canadensis TaxID=72917 RepID=UPI001CB895F0|nr:putative pectinesterase 14 [Erigeron canadensis]
MNTKRCKLFRLYVITIALVFIIISLYAKNSNITTILSFSNSNLDIVKRAIEPSGIYEFLSIINQNFNPLHSRQKLSCDENKWKSPLIKKYGVATVLTVDQKGCGTFKTFQKAVDAVPGNSPKPTLIIFDSGTYTEKVAVPKSKSNLIIQGQGYLNTFLSWNATASSSNGTVFSYSVAIYAPKFTAYNISFKNTAPPSNGDAAGGQAVALKVAGDQAAFYNCGFYGHQDTLLDFQGRHYFKNCYIEGTWDFICGNGRSLYENCTLNSVAKGRGAVAAQKRGSLQEKTGFSFVNCKLGGTGKILLGRAWGEYSTTVFIKTSMTSIVSPEGWDNWKDPSRNQKVFFGEYNCTGPGANPKGRVKFAKQLSAADAKPYMDISYIDGNDWLPKDVNT